MSSPRRGSDLRFLPWWLPGDSRCSLSTDPSCCCDYYFRSTGRGWGALGLKLKRGLGGSGEGQECQAEKSDWGSSAPTNWPHSP
jgi:hypothetical protein